ncbi:MAG TPA: four helix bundle protein [Gemmatimonadaceae bacterium]|nr:four helix bundle protein [Gemmatimonadaceae bacterium]
MTGSIRDYRDLLAWQKAMDLAVEVDIVCDALPTKYSYLSTQMRRAVNSVHSNIAEGNGRFSRSDYLRFLSDANGSLREVESDLAFVARRFGRTKHTRDALALCELVAKLVAGLVRSLRGDRKKEEGDQDSA